MSRVFVNNALTIGRAPYSEYLVDYARSLYIAASVQYEDLPYHNFQHALEVANNAFQLADKYAPDINYKILLAAALFHDAGYHEPAPPELTKEAYSARIFNSLANTIDFGLSKKEIEEVKDAIISTNVDENPPSIYGKILNRADLKSVGSTDGSFNEIYSLLRKEAKDEKLRTGQKFSEARFAMGSIVALGKYYAKDLKLGPDDSEWSDIAASNITSRALEEVRRRHINTIKYLGRLARQGMPIEKIPGLSVLVKPTDMLAKKK